jgi:hypothetical protein
LGLNQPAASVWEVVRAISQTSQGLLHLPLTNPSAPSITPPQDGGTYFCPTVLASTLCGGGAAAAGALSPDGLAASGGGGGYVIVETNFRVSPCTPVRCA